MVRQKSNRSFLTLWFLAVGGFKGGLLMSREIIGLGGKKEARGVSIDHHFVSLGSPFWCIKVRCT